MRFSIDEYSKEFKMSKEMIHSRLKSKKLNYIIEEGTTYIIVARSSLDSIQREEMHQRKAQQTQAQQVKRPAQAKPKTTAAAIISLYQKENTHLKVRIKELEDKIDKLIDDKERMLIQERERIEGVYESKDAQLKSILNLINTKLLLSQDAPKVHEVEASTEPEEMIEMDIASKIIDLKSYLKKLNLSAEDKKVIKKRFAKAYGHDSRILAQNGQIYLDFSQYDYSDLLKITA